MYNWIIKTICKAEGKKVQTSVGNVREIFKIICRMMAKSEKLVKYMVAYGHKSLRNDS